MSAFGGVRPGPPYHRAAHAALVPKRFTVGMATVATGVGALLGGAVGAGADTPWLAIVLAVLGSGATTAIIGWAQRRSSGEGPAAAARDMVESAAHMAEASDAMNLPLYRRIAEQQQEVADLTNRFATARIERHEAVNEAAALKAKLAGMDYELAALRVRVGDQPGRRDTD